MLCCYLLLPSSSLGTTQSSVPGREPEPGETISDVPRTMNLPLQASFSANCPAWSFSAYAKVAIAPVKYQRPQHLPSLLLQPINAFIFGLNETFRGVRNGRAVECAANPAKLS